MNKIGAIATTLLALLACGGSEKQPATAAATEVATTPTPAADAEPEPEPEEQSFEQAMTIFCDAVKESGVEKHEDATQKPVILAEWINERVTNSEFLEMFSELAAKAPAERRPHVEKAAKRAGIDECQTINALYEQ